MKTITIQDPTQKLTEQDIQDICDTYGVFVQINNGATFEEYSPYQKEIKVAKGHDFGFSNYVYDHVLEIEEGVENGTIHPTVEPEGI